MARVELIIVQSNHYKEKDTTTSEILLLPRNNQQALLRKAGTEPGKTYFQQKSSESQDLILGILSGSAN